MLHPPVLGIGNARGQPCLGRGVVAHAQVLDAHGLAILKVRKPDLVEGIAADVFDVVDLHRTRARVQF